MKQLFLFAFLLIFSGSSFSQEISKMASIPFKIDTEKLLKGEVHYAFILGTPKKVKEKWDWARDFDSIGLLKQQETRVLMSKFAYVVNKPIGFFDHTHLSDERFISHVMGEQKVIKTGESSFSVEVPGTTTLKYKMNSYFDSDDISSLTKPKAIHAVTAMKKVDPLSQSASSTVFKEMVDYSGLLLGSVMAVNYVALKENKTLVIIYQMSALTEKVNKTVLEKGLVEEALAQKQLIESYK